MPTLKEIAQRAGVSIPTVSRVLRGQAKETWPVMAKRAAVIRDIAAELNFRPNAAARAIRSQRTHQVGVLVRNSEESDGLAYTDLAGYEVILGINQELEKADYVLSIVRFDDVAGSQPQLLSRVFREKMLDGIIALGSIPEFVCQKLTGQNCLWVNSNLWWPQRCIRRDDLHVGRTIAQELADLGYQRLVWVDLDLAEASPHYSTEQRLQGVSEVARARGLELAALRCPLTSTAAERTNLRRLLQPDTAFVAYNSAVAEKLDRAAISLSRLAGRHYGLASCDDMHHIVINWPELSRVGFDRFTLGRKAAQMILKLIDEPSSPCPSELVRDAWIAGQTAPARGRPRVQAGGATGRSPAAEMPTANDPR